MVVEGENECCKGFCISGGDTVLSRELRAADMDLSRVDSRAIEFNAVYVRPGWCLMSDRFGLCV